MKVTYKQIFYFAICAILMLLPRRWFIFGIQSYRLLLLGMLLLYCKRVKFNKNFFNIVTVLYIAYVAVYYLVDSGVMSFLGFVIDTVGLFMLVYTNISSKKELQAFLDVFVNTTVVYSFFCIIQALTEFNIFDLIAGEKSGVASTSVYYRFGLVRSYGSFTTSINNALFLVLAICVILYKLDTVHTLRKKRRMIVALIITTLAAVFTLSRFPLMLLGLVYVAWLIKKGILKFLLHNLVKIIACVLLVSAVFVTSESVRNVTSNFVNMFVAVFDSTAQEKISDSFGVNVEGVGERVLLYTWVREKIHGNEALGVGPEAEIVFKYTDEWNKEREKTSIENQYLNMLIDFGYIGLGLFVAFTVYLLFYSVRRLKYGTKGTFDFWYMVTIAQLTYIICMFSVASVDDMRTYFTIIACMYVVGDKFNNCEFSIDNDYEQIIC